MDIQRRPNGRLSLINLDKRWKMCCVAEEFFILSSGLAGEVLQKLINYGGRIALYGDFSHYTSKPLLDFMYESNKGVRCVLCFHGGRGCRSYDTIKQTGRLPCLFAHKFEDLSGARAGCIDF